MEQSPITSGAGTTRRAFLGTGAAASLAAGVMVHSSVAAAETPAEVRLGVVGCGGRGTGAIGNSLEINSGVKLVAVADLYASKCAGLVKTMAKMHPEKVAVEEASMHAGLDSSPDHTCSA